ncbi:MAG: hypothetical protein WB555_09505, partial [Candidatus Korobacteraceae bacterium]
AQHAAKRSAGYAVINDPESLQGRQGFATTTFEPELRSLIPAVMQKLIPRPAENTALTNVFAAS